MRQMRYFLISRLTRLLGVGLLFGRAKCVLIVFLYFTFPAAECASIFVPTSGGVI